MKRINMPPSITRMKINLNHLFFTKVEINKAALKVLKINKTIREIGWELAQNITPIIIINLISENSIINI